MTLSSDEKRGLRFAGIAFLLTLVAVGLLVVPYNGILRDPETHAVLKSPFMTSIVVVISLLFMIPGIAYGIGERSIKNDSQVINLMSKSMSSMGSYIVLVFFASQFVAYFGYTKLGTVIAVNGANVLERTGI